MGKGRPGHGKMLRPVGLPAIILFPSHLASVSVQVFAADMVVLANFRPAHPAVKTLRYVCASAVQAVSLLVIDSLHYITGV